MQGDDLWGPVLGAGIALVAAVLVPFATAEWSRWSERRRTLLEARREALNEVLSVLVELNAGDRNVIKYGLRVAALGPFLPPGSGKVLIEYLLTFQGGFGHAREVATVGMNLSRWVAGRPWWYAKLPIVKAMSEITASKNTPKAGSANQS